MAAFDAALAEGADGIELDIQLSADEVPVVFHDDRLGKLGHPLSRISNYTHAELKAMDAGRWFGGAPAVVPSLDEVLEAYAGKLRLYLEIKFTEKRGAGRSARHRQLALAVAQRIAGTAFVDQISVLSFHSDALSAVAAAQPQIACVRNVEYGWHLPFISRQAVQAAGISFNVDRFKQRHARALAAFGLPLFSYTCNTPEQLLHARSLGVTHFITNYPARSREILAARSSALSAGREC